MNPVDFLHANPLLNNVLGFLSLLVPAALVVYLARVKIGLRRNRMRVVDDD